mgnify:CR=1 FL=1
MVRLINLPDWEQAHFLAKKMPPLGPPMWVKLSKPMAELRIALLDELWPYPALPITVRHQTWRPNDTILWDNRRVLHHRDDFDNKTRRLMKRCQVLARASSD